MSSATPTTHDDVQSDNDSENDKFEDARWVVSNGNGVFLSKHGRSDYRFSTDETTVKFEGVREEDDGGYALNGRKHRTNAIVHVTGTVEAVLDVLSHEL